MPEVSALGVRAYGDGLLETAASLKKLKDAAKGAEESAEKLTDTTVGLGKTNVTVMPGIKRTGTEIERTGTEAKKTTGALERMATSMKGKLNGALVSMSSLLGSAAGRLVAMGTAALSVAGYYRLADAWSDMQSKLGAAIKDMKLAPDMMMRMVNVANASYSPLQQTVEVYSRNVAVLRDLGHGAQAAADYTESLNHMLVITATKGERAASVQEALSKAMAVGKLQADGLETVMASGGRVAEALAKQLGTNVNGLRQMASEGKITSAVISGALIESLQQVRDEAAEMPATVADGFTRISTGIQAIIGIFDKTVGASGALAGALVAVGDAFAAMAQWMYENGSTIQTVFDTVIGGAIVVATGAVVAFGTALAVTMVGSITAAASAAAAHAIAMGATTTATMLASTATTMLAGAFGLLSKALLLTGLGAVVVGAGYLIGKFLELVRAVGGFGEAMAMVKTLAEEVWQRIRSGFDGLVLSVKAGWEVVAGSATGAMANLLDSVGGAIDNVIGFFAGAYAAVVAAWDQLPAAFARIGAMAMNALVGIVEAGAAALVAPVNALLTSVGLNAIVPDLSGWRAAEGEAVEIGSSMAAAFENAMGKNYTSTHVADGLRETSESYKTAAASSKEFAMAAIENATKPLTALEAMQAATDKAAAALAGGAGATDAPGGGGSGGGLAGAAGKAAGKASELAQEVAKLNKAALEGRTPMEKYTASLAKLDQLRKAGLSDKAYSMELERINDELANGIPIVNELAQSWSDWIMGGFKDFKGFVKNVMDSFKKLIGDMITTALRNKIIIPIATAVMGGGGGIAGAAAAATGGGGGLGSLGMLGSLGGGISNFMAGITGPLQSGLSAAMQGGLTAGVKAFTASANASASGVFGLASKMGTLLGSAALGFGVGSIISGGYSAIGKNPAISNALGTGIGMALGGPIGAIIGGALGGVVNRLFGRKLKDTGIEGKYRDGEFDGNTYEFYKGGLFRSDKTKRKDMDDAMSKMFEDTLDAMRVQVGGMATILGKAPDALEDFTTSFKLSLKGLSEEKAQAKIEEEFTKIANQMVKSIYTLGTETVKAAGLAGLFGKTTTKTRLDPEFVKFQKDGETAYETLTRLSTALTSVNDVFDILGKNMFAASLAGADLASNIAEAFGGVEAMGQAVGVYWQEFYSEEERLATNTRRLRETFEELGQTMPTSREAFRALVESIDTSTKEGGELYAKLIMLSGALAGVLQPVEDLTVGIREMVKSILGDLDLMPTSRNQFNARGGLRIDEALAASRAGDMEATRKLLETVRMGSNSDLAYREIAAKVLAQFGAGINVPQFATGGSHTGGLRIVGENGPELEATGPSKIYSNAQTAAMLSGGQGDPLIRELLLEIRALREENRQLGLRADRHQKTTADTLDKWDKIGAPVVALGAGESEW